MLFETIKEKIRIEDVVRKYADCELIDDGSSDRLQLEDKTCPSCKHSDCFKIFLDTNTWRCFSEGISGDSASFLANLTGITQREAAIKILEDFGIKLPVGYSKRQEIFTVAAGYYHACLVETCTKPVQELGGLTPLQYQVKTRGHRKETIEDYQIGFSDGRLVPHLMSLGYDLEEIKESGLLSRSGKSDFFGKNFFIYPHIVNDRVSHFTLKDPLKAAKYQLSNKYSLNGILFYNQDSLRGTKKVIIVEGENDLLSVYEGGWTDAIIATIGTLSKEQIEFIRDNLYEYEVITIFDNDDAGDQYRNKIQGISRFIKSLTQIIPGERGEDVDNLLKKKSQSLETILKAYTPKVPDKEAVIVEDPEEKSQVSGLLGNSIVVKNNCYYKLKVDKDGGTIPVLLSNFVMELRNVYVRQEDRTRDVILVRHDGMRSKPTIFDSQTKVSLKHFKEKVANAADASFYGNELDLAAIWEYVYNSSPKRTVLIPQEVGCLDFGDGVSCWVFDNVMIEPAGHIVKPDEDGVYRTNDKDGIKPVPIDDNSTRKITSSRMSKMFKTPDIPWMNVEIYNGELEKLKQDYIRNLGRNLGDQGMALIMTGWGMMNAYSNLIFSEYDFVPFLFFWGRHGKGKTNILKWVLSLYDTHDCGYHAVSQMGSGVAFQRKAGYYSSLPMAVDELRDDQQTREFYAMFRAFYNRTGRSTGTREPGRVRNQKIVSNFILCGQDIISDEALATRVVGIKIPSAGRELVETYHWMNDLMKHRAFGAIGLSWVSEAMTADKEQVLNGIKSMKTLLRETRCQERVSGNLAIVGYFSQILAEKYVPEFDFKKYLTEYAHKIESDHSENDIALQFLEVVNGMCSSNKDHFNSSCMRTDKKTLYMWFNEVYRLVNKEMPGKDRESFSPKAIKAALFDTNFVTDKTPAGKDLKMKLAGKDQRVIAFDLEKSPDSVKNIAEIVHTWMG